MHFKVALYLLFCTHCLAISHGPPPSSQPGGPQVKKSLGLQHNYVIKIKLSIKRPLIKKKPKWPPKKASIIKMTIFEILFEQEFYDLTLLLYKYFIRGGGGGLENI